MSLDLGEFVLDSDKYGLSLYRKKIRINSKTQESTQYLDQRLESAINPKEGK